MIVGLPPSPFYQARKRGTANDWVNQVLDGAIRSRFMTSACRCRACAQLCSSPDEVVPHVAATDPTHSFRGRSTRASQRWRDEAGARCERAPVPACVERAERVERVERGLACLTPFLRSCHTLYASRKTFVALV